jgi:hypothetical protein
MQGNSVAEENIYKRNLKTQMAKHFRQWKEMNKEGSKAMVWIWRVAPPCGCKGWGWGGRQFLSSGQLFS